MNVESREEMGIGFPLALLPNLQRERSH